jgi:hypothetical protein
MANDWVPTPRLRWVGVPAPRLQQWWAEDVPAYMRSTAAGEWRDVPQVVGEVGPTGGEPPMGNSTP